MLVNKGASVNCTKEKGLTSLHYAAARGHIACLDLLLSAGASVNARDDDGNTCLHLAAANGHAEGVHKLAKVHIPINTPNSSGATPLHYAICRNDVDIVVYLVENGADTNLCDQNSVSPLHLASHEGNHSIVAYLISKGAVIDVANSKGQTPLHLAMIKKHKQSAYALIYNGADMNLMDHEGRSPKEFVKDLDQGAERILGLEEKEKRFSAPLNLDLSQRERDLLVHERILKVVHAVVSRYRQNPYHLVRWLLDKEHLLVLSLFKVQGTDWKAVAKSVMVLFRFAGGWTSLVKNFPFHVRWRRQRVP
eukprot:TRINITY_DN4517_c0_g8_i1.p1 TRINITY_DN4517_c0_g8~~TRINITY_DN4517_c0_g8_i1.p1  ORF type:complete len:343 (-),score=73.47 TRINITY_DN4517_c0_g8_i1:863-1783(-)